MVRVLWLSKTGCPWRVVRVGRSASWVVMHLPLLVRTVQRAWSGSPRKRPRSGLVDGEVGHVARGHRRRETRSAADGTVDVQDDGASPANEVVAVVPDAQLVERGRSGRLEPAGDAAGDQ